MKLILSTTATLMLASGGALAQGFTGASVGLEYSDFSDVDGLRSTLFRGSAEFEVAPSFSVAADLTLRNFEGIDEDVTNFVIHGIYAVSPDVSVGLYLGRETIDDSEIDNYGIEAAYASGDFSGEAYLGGGEARRTDLTYFGLSGNYGLGNGFSVLGGYDTVHLDAGSGFEARYNVLALGGQYEMTNGAAFFAKVGQIQGEGDGGSDEENFYSLGVTFSFGPQGGTTFGPRGLFDTLPFPL